MSKVLRSTRSIVAFKINHFSFYGKTHWGYYIDSWLITITSIYHNTSSHTIDIKKELGSLSERKIKSSSFENWYIYIVLGMLQGQVVVLMDGWRVAGIWGACNHDISKPSLSFKKTKLLWSAWFLVKWLNLVLPDENNLIGILIWLKWLVMFLSLCFIFFQP